MATEIEKFIKRIEIYPKALGVLGPEDKNIQTTKVKAYKTIWATFCRCTKSRNRKII